MMARTESRALSCVPERDRLRVLEAVLVARDENAAAEDERTLVLASKVSGVLSAAELAAWQPHLADMATAQEKVARVFEENDLAAMRVGLLAAGDVRSAMRAVARLSPDNKRPPGVARLEDFEAFFASMPIIAQLLSFAASEMFGAALTSA
jgi:hypothetical protein